MTIKGLPDLPKGTQHLGPANGPEEITAVDGTTEALWARYRVDELLVSIGWTVGHPLGSFRGPDRLVIDPDLETYADTYGQGNNLGLPRTRAFDGITTSLLRKLPMAHAIALMRDRHEHLSVAQVRKEITPLPARVETDADYVHIASAYVALGSTSVEPIKRLTEWTGESVDTWSARLRRARAKGILEGKGRDARITAAFEGQSNELWRTMRARKGKNDGD